jgi:hypothetical protein
MPMPCSVSEFEITDANSKHGVIHAGAITITVKDNHGEVLVRIQTDTPANKFAAAILDEAAAILNMAG